MADPIIADALRRAFGSKTAVDDVSLHVPAGKAVGLIGANGAGKSTLLKMLVGLLQPSRGRATLMGHDTRTLPASVFARVGYMAECQHLPAVRTVRDLLAYCRPLYRTWDAALATRLLDLLTLSPSTGLVRASRGERMKAALVATLAFHPDVLVLDEPLEGLDPLTREQVVDGLLELVSAEGTTVLLASHDLDVLERLLDEVVMLHDGRVLFQTSLDDLLTRYRLIEIAGADVSDATRLPSGCLDARGIPAGLQFLLTDYSENATLLRLQMAFPGADVRVLRPALRDAFVAHARSMRGGAGLRGTA